MLLMLSACSNADSIEKVAKGYVESWEKVNYSDMYSMLSSTAKERIKEEGFTEKFTDFYDDIGLKDIEIKLSIDEKELKAKDKKEEATTLPVRVKLTTRYGEKEYDCEIPLVKEKVEGKDIWRVDWNYNLIYRGMAEGDRVKSTVVAPVRGEILDRNGFAIATNGTALQIGIVPGRLGNMKEEMIKELASAFNISQEYINNRLKLSWVRDDTFVDLVKVANEKESVIKTLNMKNSGATYKVTYERVYPYKEAAAHLTGYLGYINEEELKELEKEGFSSNDKIGRTGLEKIFDKSLRGVPGKKISLLNEDGKEKEVLFEKEVVMGENLNLTIDVEMQKKLYAQMNGEKGTAASMNYNTGEIMALVSSPSYDPNKFILGIQSDELKNLQESADKPLLNRFTKVYVPGSTFKPITAAIGLNENIVDENFSINVSGLQWQKDSSWGKYYITRVTDPASSVNLEKAMVYSDNIYFGQLALKIGSKTFIDKAKDFGIGVDLAIRYGVDKSQMAKKDSISEDILLADSGYGQGQVLVNILNLPKAYSAFVNKGRVVEPVLILTGDEVEKTEVISQEVAGKVLGFMTKVIEDSKGTGREAYIAGKKLAGKTGTAEVNNPNDKTKKSELGWFVAIDQSEATPYISSMMIEDVKGRGGSHFVIPKVKGFIQAYSD